jgi:hypothetical protein
MNNTENAGKACTEKMNERTAALKMLRKPLFGLQNRRKHPERYVQYPINFFFKY